MRGTGALARASMADLKPDRVRAAELAQTGAGRGRARGEQAEREHESTCTLLEHDPDFIMRGLRAGKENEDGCCRKMANASAGLVPALAGRGLYSVGLGGLVGDSGRNGCGQGREGQELVGNNSGGLVAGGNGGG